MSKAHQTQPMSIADCVPDKIIFAAIIGKRHVRLFMQIIKAMSFVGNTEIQVGADGLKYVVDESKSFQIAAYIKKDFFESYIFPRRQKADIAFAVNFSSLTEFLSAILDNDLSSLKMVYYGDANPLAVVLVQTDSKDSMRHTTKSMTVQGDLDMDEEPAGNITTECLLSTRESQNPIDFALADPQLSSSLILDAQEFHSLINDFDRTIDELHIKISSKSLILRSVGILQYETVVKLTRDNEIFIRFDQVQTSRFSYNFNYFKVLLRTLYMAKKICLETHIDGLLKVQLMVPSNFDDEDTSLIFIEYFMVPSLADDEEEDD